MSERGEKGGKNNESDWCRSAFIAAIATVEGKTSQIRKLLLYCFLSSFFYLSSYL